MNKYASEILGVVDNIRDWCDIVCAGDVWSSVDMWIGIGIVRLDSDRCAYCGDIGIVGNFVV